MATAQSAWIKTPTPNLFRNRASQVYYLRARIGKRNAYRESLRTTNYDIARARLAARLTELRATRPLRAGEAPETLWDALRAVEAKTAATPALKASSRDTYARVVGSLKPGRPCGVPVGPIERVTAGDMDEWWKRATTVHAPARANYLLLFIKRATRFALSAHAIHRDPAAHLMRMHIPRTKLRLMSSEDFALLIADMRGAGNRDAADWVEFVSYTGTRPAEANAVRWADIDRAANVVSIHGGKHGTKNYESRRVPITSSLAALLDHMEPARRGEFVLALKTPAGAVKATCERLGLQAPRLYDFRHLFATRCNESGVDIPTISRWLGHKDGGKLAMATYVHVGNDHEQRKAATVRF